MTNDISEYCVHQCQNSGTLLFIIIIIQCSSTEADYMGAKISHSTSKILFQMFNIVFF